MRIGLIDVDGHNFPNLALMKLSAYHKSRGDTVEWWWSDWEYYDIVYKSKVFDNTYSLDSPDPMNCGRIIKGGTGYGMKNELPYEIEHMYPDYTLYPELTKDTAYGFLTRGCPRNCKFCIVGEKEGLKSVKVADLSEFWNGQKFIKLMDPNITACKERENLLTQLAKSGAWVDFTQGLDARLLNVRIIEILNSIKIKMIHFAWDNMKDREAVIDGLSLYAKYGKKKYRERRVYVLTNFDTNFYEDVYRIYTLREMEFDPYVMVYDKPNAPKRTKRLQRWVNNKKIFRKCEFFEDYDERIG
jgi:hypothetical protein